MAKQNISKRNLQFMMKEVFNAAEVTSHPRFEHIDAEAIDMILESTEQIADNVAAPIAVEMDHVQAELENDKVTVHAKVHEYTRLMGESGLIGVFAPLEMGGSQLPVTVNTASGLIMSAANNALTMFSGLTSGAANLIVSFGNKELQDTYLPKMFSGEWQGTMCLTEPQAGSSLHYITSVATPTGEPGKYKIKGQKIYISAGDYEGVENVVHLYLAKIEGGPAGAKGISLFVVPKYRPENGQLVDNDVKTAGIFHKMGQRGTPALHIQVGDEDNCYGWLVGEEHRGLPQMFQMMNEARIGVGVTGAAIASAAYYEALQYAHERPQGQRLDIKGQDPNAPQTLIINHADVKRMLLFQKAIVEGSISLILQGAKYADYELTTEGEEKERYQLLLDFLTPVIKTFPTEFGVESVSSSMQVFGGGGYCTDFPLERLYRDIRITTIYEGTTGIQSLALLGRNITMKNGKAAMAFFQEVTKDIQAAKTHNELKPFAEQLEKSAQELQKVTQHLVGFAMKGQVELFLKDATLYMELFGLVTVGWQWLKQGTVAKEALVTKNPQGDDLHFYESKIHTMKYYFAYVLPRTKGLIDPLMNAEALTVDAAQQALIM
ncbi:acyl-CoA dehydrogenase [Eisenibacter elegans]|jgi:butyryl-CoA dehydrogenase|uniref:acyl-CoA dehydrogenase n=1 Tax=Eisenibacter elegans TaxID=997 RepID=UPI00041D0B69|nr:acyl-CoA dehydrogenase [Eisenibacter elegans]